MYRDYTENSVEAIISVILSIINIDGEIHENETILKKELFKKFNSMSFNPCQEYELENFEARFYEDFDIAKEKGTLLNLTEYHLNKITDKFIASTLLICLISMAKSDNDYHELEKNFIHKASNLWKNLE
jgi:uncharacterized tellurite resistance protein B-like protein